jgi:hypothetical protein
MSKVMESLVSDAIQRVSTPEAKAVVQTHLLSPLVALILEALAPYLLGFAVLWTVLLVGIFTLLLRRGIQ